MIQIINRIIDICTISSDAFTGVFLLICALLIFVGVLTVKVFEQLTIIIRGYNPYEYPSDEETEE